MTATRPTAALLVLVGLCAALLAGCGSHPASRPAADRDATLSVRSTPGLGQFLVTDGWTVYMYPPDRQRQVTCTKADQCQEAWPPVFLGAGHRVLAGPGVKQNLIATRPGDGGRVVTYNGWPLYFYVGDKKAGEVNGQNQGFNWFVMRPDGVPNKTDMASPTG